MIENTGFETAEPGLEPGDARYWEAVTHGTGEETATFAGDTGRAPLGYETFGFGWGWLDPQRVRVTLAFGEVESIVPEDFSAWAVNQTFVGLAGTEAATFNSHTTATESFSLWGAEVDTDFVLSSGELERAQFNGAGQETFVWSTLMVELGPSVIAAFDDGTDDTEHFAYRARQAMYAHLAAHVLMRVDGADYVGELSERVTLQAEGDGEIPSNFAEGVTYYVRSYSGSGVSLGFYPIGVGDSGDIDVTDRGTGQFWIVGDPLRFWLDPLD